MQKIDVVDLSPEWHAMRANAWTASLAATLVVRENALLLQAEAKRKGIYLNVEPLLRVGLESFFENTLWKVWAEKMGNIPKFSGNAHTQRGQLNEEKVICTFEANNLILVERKVIAHADRRPWFVASLDAVVPASADVSVVAPNGFPLEAKCPAFNSRKKLWDSKKAGNLAVMGLPYYWCQLQHQIAVMQAPYGWFVAAGVEVDKTTGLEKVVFPIMEKVPRDDAFLAAYEAAAKFYYEEFIDGFNEPPKTDNDLKLLAKLTEEAQIARSMAESDTTLAVDLYLNSLSAEASAVAKRKELEALVLKAANDARTDGCDCVVLADRLEVKYSTTSSLSWQKVAKLLAEKAGLEEIPPEMLKACESKPNEKAKLKLKELA